MANFIERYSDKVVGVYSCYDRVLVYGTLTDIGHKTAMSMYLRSNEIPLEQFTEHFKGLTNEITRNAEVIAERNGLQIEWVRRGSFRKEDRVREVLEERGEHPGLVHIFSATERCKTFQVNRSKKDGYRYLAPRDGQCKHYYFYFIDDDLGLCFMKVPTWAPFRIQFYFNGHNWLAGQLETDGVGFTLVDNAFVDLEDYPRAQQLSDAFHPRMLHNKLDDYARLLCPVLRHFAHGYHWSIAQIEYATDIVFDTVDSLQPIYDHLVRAAIHDVRAEDVATFLGRKLDDRYIGEINSYFNTRIQGTRIKHHMGKASIKMYDKLGRILRIETTTNDVTFFKHHRLVEHRDGSKTRKVAGVKKRIYSLPIMAELLGASNRRYLDFISALDDPSSGNRHLRKITEPVRQNERSYRGFNPLNEEDSALFVALARAEFNISGLRNRDLRHHLGKKPHQVSRLLKRLRLHGLIKKVGRTYKYYLTRLGKAVLTCALHIKQQIVIPDLALTPT